MTRRTETERDPRRWARVAWAALCVALFFGLGYAYHRWVWTRLEPTFQLAYRDATYELLDPRMLGVGLVAPWFLLVLGWTLADLPWPQRVITVLTRMAFVALLALGLSRPVRPAETDKIATVYLVDVSNSVSDEALADAQTHVDEAFGLRREDDLVRVVTFAKRPRLLPEVRGEDGASPKPPTVARHGDPSSTSGATTSSSSSPASLPSATASSSSDDRPTDVPDDPGAGSNLQAALQLAYGLYPPGYLRRAVLVSDGLQTQGDVLAEANRAAEYGITLHTLAYDRPLPPEVAIENLRLPGRVEVGETFKVVAGVYASRATGATARLSMGETLNGLEPIKKLELKPGNNEVVFKSVVRVAGEVTYTLALSDLEADRFVANNRYATTVDVPGRPQVLYVEGAPQYAGPLARALTAQQFDVDVRPPVGFPGSLSELERYDFLILSDTPKEAVGLQSQVLIEQYIRDLGGGFLFAGGENGYGLGGWDRTTVARLLPVRMDIERRKEMPSVAMLLVMDRSGSMTGLPMDMAKKAAKATVEVLGRDDAIGVIAFDGQPHRYVKMQPARNGSRIRGQISRITPGGGTAIFPALDAAYNDMTVFQARKKHVILLTDGKAPSAGIRDLVTAMIAEGITVTTVGLGDDVDEQLLKMIADVGGGNYHQVPDPLSLPRIFTKETEMVARQAAVEEWFPVVQTGYAAFLRRLDIRTAPYLRGYVATRLKPTPATELLASADTEEPILARWRVGTGWSLAWTSDVKARWATEWTTWPGWERFWGQLVREHMRQKDRRELEMKADIVDGTLVATIDAFTADDRFDNQLVSKLTVVGPEPGGETRTIEMQQIAPGRYEARTDMVRFGSFLLRAEHACVLDDGSLQPIATSSGHVSHPYPREYASFEPDRVVLERAALATSGTFEPTDLRVAFDPQGEEITYNEELWPRAIMAAVVVFLLDLLLRRVRLFDRGFRRGRQRRATGLT
ncbi:MAG: VWA domain-containing protein [Myxococcota bacterium]